MLSDAELQCGLIGVQCHYRHTGATQEAQQIVDRLYVRFKELLGLEDRFVTLLMDTAQHWNIYAAANQEHPEKVAAGLAVDKVCRELATEVRAWTERSEPTPGEPTVEPASE